MRELKYLNTLYIKNSITDNKIFEYLNSNDILECENINEALELIKKQKIDLIIIDGKVDILYLKKIREFNKNTQIIIFKDSIKAAYLFDALNLQYVKYLTKPIDKIKLSLALKDCMKALDSNKSNIVKLKNDFIYDSYNNVLFKANKIITLSKKEGMFLNFIVGNQNRAISYHEINNSIWKGSMTQDALRSVVKELRRKIYKELIKNISGVGYRIDLV